MDNPVGPVLRMCDEVDLVIDAIREDNPDADVEVVDRGAYVRVQADNYLRLTEATLQRHLGAGSQPLRQTVRTNPKNDERHEEFLLWKAFEGNEAA